MNQISKEVAESEFQRFVDGMDLLVDEETMTKDDQKGFRDAKSRIVREIMRGRATVNDVGEITFTPSRSGERDTITFYEPSGDVLRCTDKRGKDEDVGKMYTAIGRLTRTDAKTIETLKGSDLRFCMAVFALFFG